MSDDSEDAGDRFAFHAPPDFATALHQAGFTVMNDANNHSYDYGQLGEEETVEALYGAGTKSASRTTQAGAASAAAVP